MGSGFAESGNARIYYEDLGSGTPLVLIHAGYLDRRMWDNQITELRKGNRVIRYDVRGFGRSSKAREEYSDYRDLEALLDHLNTEEAIILGASNGGRIALDFAVEYPSRVSALILVGSGIRGYESQGNESDLWGDLSSLEEKYLDLRSKGDLRGAAAIDVDIWTHLLSPSDRKWILDVAEENVNTEDEDVDKFQVSPEPPAFLRLETLDIPALVMVGKEDLKGMLEIGQSIHSHLKSSEFELVENADHLPSITNPEAFLRLVTGFISRISRE